MNITSYFTNKKSGILWLIFVGCIGNIACFNNDRSDAFAQKKPGSTYQASLKSPAYVYNVRDHVRMHQRPMPGYVGGRTFKNLEKLLPFYTNNGQKIRYQEWDVKPKRKGKNRGAERLVTGSDGTDYYTKNHYRSFVKL
jgi:ribonuclease T1